MSSETRNVIKVLCRSSSDMSSQAQGPEWHHKRLTSEGWMIQQIKMVETLHHCLIYVFSYCRCDFKTARNIVDNFQSAALAVMPALNAKFETPRLVSSYSFLSMIHCAFIWRSDGSKSKRCMPCWDTTMIHPMLSKVMQTSVTWVDSELVHAADRTGELTVWAISISTRFVDGNGHILTSRILPFLVFLQVKSCSFGQCAKENQSIGNRPWLVFIFFDSLFHSNLTIQLQCQHNVNRKNSK